MVEWVFVNTNTINRIGYNKDVQSMYIDFVGSDVDTAFVKVPRSLYKSFLKSKSPDQFFQQYIEGSYKAITPSANNHFYRLKA